MERGITDESCPSNTGEGGGADRNPLYDTDGRLDMSGMSKMSITGSTAQSGITSFLIAVFEVVARSSGTF